jgi:hypothetical protein
MNDNFQVDIDYNKKTISCVGLKELSLTYKDLYNVLIDKFDDFDCLGESIKNKRKINYDSIIKNLKKDQ